MNKNLIIRLLTIGLLMVILLVPIGLIRSVVADRSQLQANVEQTIAETSAGAQRVAVILSTFH